ncbi:glycosyltransferase [Halochromatium glycolicum]|uniref:Dolichol monophosphate mannose synthase n=1 Tax=Halochromatium glycolicum TaxID=85075 RepID=A0AAJ0X9I4_9GAMM|nr:glycosyltransferase family 2 protein [Halochromatium glycolicum]MBK1703777.1 dolichol monophosphate mannose synthase [Halochromatium glycolicum]
MPEATLADAAPLSRCRTPTLAVVVPTYNEAENVPILVARLEQALAGIDWELIFVDDDSPDGTAQRVRAIACTNPHLRVLQRIGRRGLSSACIEGMLATSAPFVAVMDADLQHDEGLLPEMLRLLRSEPLDLVVGSRYVSGGEVGTWDRRRASMSRLATRLGQRLIKADLKDPMSGFFMLRAEVLQGCVRDMSAVGYKILLDLFATHPGPLRFRELPYRFRPREAGQSKLDNAVLWEYLLMLIQKWIGPMIPARFIAFSLIGASGVLVHMLVLWLAFKLAGSSFLVGQTIAALVAMTSNFFLNNLLTYSDMRLRGWDLLRGWLSFVAACSIGALANVGIASWLFQAHSFWVLSALAGILVGAVWNYAVTAVYTWKRPKAA